MDWFSFLLLGLATFRLTRLLVYDKITQFIRAPFYEIREEKNSDGIVEPVMFVKKEGLHSFIGELLSCHWCTGIWCALLLYFGITFCPSIFYPISYILGIAAIGGLIEDKLS